MLTVAILALRHGLHFVYTGNVHDPAGGTTTCPGCATPVVERDWYVVGRYDITDDGHCARCGTAIPGRYAGPAGRWGARRLPVTVSGRT